MRAAAISGDASLDEQVWRAMREQPPMAGRALVHDVSTREPYVYSEHGRARVAVVDYGCKRSILRRLAGAGAQRRSFRTTCPPTSSRRTTA